MLNFTLRFASLLAFALVSVAASAQASFYGGDPDFVDALGSERNTLFDELLTYDDFTLGTAGEVTRMYGNFGTDAVVRGLYYEIRSGVSKGDGGTLLYSGTLAPTVVATGGSLIGFDTYRISGAPTGVVLQPGTYWLTLAVVDGGLGRAFIATTSGAGSIGAPIANGNSFFTSSLGDFFIPTALPLVATNSADFSMGIDTRPVPEPASFAALGLGALAVVRRRRRAA